METAVWILILLFTLGVSVFCLIAQRVFQSAYLRRVFPGMAAFLFLVPTVVFTVRLPLNGAVAALHLTVFALFALLADAVIAAVQKKRERKNDRDCGDVETRAARLGRVFSAAAFGCLVYLALGFWCAKTVLRTEYGFATSKTVPGGELVIVQISDVHLGTTADSAAFRRLLLRIESEHADMIAVTGDFVDENTKKQEMRKACEAFSEITGETSVYYVAGNHDYPENAEFTAEELYEALTGAGVRVLRDEVVLADEGYYVVGRKDRTEERAGISELTRELDRSKFIVVLDHQPNDFEKEAKSGADLVLCGHMHGGYLMPIRMLQGVMTGFFGDADCYAGTRTVGGTSFVVSTGVGTWGCSIKTGTKSEYVVIKITDAK